MAHAYIRHTLSDDPVIAVFPGQQVSLVQLMIEAAMQGPNRDLIIADAGDGLIRIPKANITEITYEP